MEMTPRDHDPVVARAARELREAPRDARWIDISASIVSKVRATTRRTWPVDAFFPASSSARTDDTLRISDHVVKTALRRALTGVHGAQATQIGLELDGHSCTGLHITVTGVYGADLRSTGDELADIAAGVVADLLGVRLPRHHISVHIDDIRTDDATHTGTDVV